MALDLSNLKKASPLGSTAPAAPPVPVSDGKPLQLAITEIEEDPNQPRKEFTEEKMAEMEASIRLRGVRQPVSVRPHPEKAGKWLLNWGARRYRGSIRAGMTTIPAFIDDTSDDFDQVIENEARDNLKPMELAMFIRDKIENAGMKKAEVARRLARPASTITELLSLVDAPASIEAIYRSGRCTSPKTLYELRSLHEKFPAEVDAWCEGDDDVTRKSVLELGDRLKGTTRVTPIKGHGDATNTVDPKAGSADPTQILSHDKGNEVGSGGGEPGGQSVKGDGSTPDNGQGSRKPSSAGGADGGSDVDTGELTSWPRGKAVSDPDSMKKPLLLISHNNRVAAVLLNRRPTDAGLIRIRYEDGGGDAEVPADECRIHLLKDADK